MGGSVTGKEEWIGGKDGSSDLEHMQSLRSSHTGRSGLVLRRERRQGAGAGGRLRKVTFISKYRTLAPTVDSRGSCHSASSTPLLALMTKAGCEWQNLSGHTSLGSGLPATSH